MKKLFSKSAVALVLVAVMLAATLQAFAAPGIVKARNEIDDKYKWDLTQLFKTEADFEKAIKDCEKMSAELVKYKGKLSKADELLKASELRSNLLELMGMVDVYAYCSYTSDMNDAANKVIDQKAANALSKIRGEIAFFEAELLNLDDASYKKLMNDPKLSAYKAYMGVLVKGKALALSPEIETVVSKATDALGALTSTYYTAAGAVRFPQITDSKGEAVDVNIGVLFSVLNSSDSKVRKDGYKALYGTINEQMGDIIAQTYKGMIAAKKFEAETRGFDTVLEMTQAIDGVPDVIYNKTTDTVKAYKDVQARFYKLNAKALKQEKTYVYDMMAPVQSDMDIVVDYDYAAKIISDGNKYLTKNSKEIVDNAIYAGRIDVYPNQGKFYNEMCIPVYGKGFYLIEVFDDSFNSLGGLAHELGHGLNAAIAEKAQPIETADSASFLSEVASYTGEILATNQLIKSAKTPEEKVYLLREQINAIQYYVLRRAMFADFEQRVFAMYDAGEPLTNETISEVFETVFKEFYPTVEITDETKYVWQSIMHFYNPFYCYKYTTSFSAAASLVTRLEAGEKGLAEKYEKFLGMGSTVDPMEALKTLGIDMTTGQPVVDFMKYYESLVDQYEKALKEAGLI